MRKVEQRRFARNGKARPTLSGTVNAEMLKMKRRDKIRRYQMVVSNCLRKREREKGELDAAGDERGEESGRSARFRREEEKE